ncbi:hypothetical protein BG005_001578 [Podila minutissima]|nr:hypothetical protein BG005_001578 [Podila minutissima]
MALWDTMMVEDLLKSSKYCIRTKRLSGHHNNINSNNRYLQFQRRSSEATLIDFDHHRSQRHWVFTSPESSTSNSFSLSSSSTTSSGRYLLSSHRRTDRRASDRGPTSSSSSSSTIYSPSPVPSPSTCLSTRTHTSEVSASPLSLPPIVERSDMVGSPFLPTSYQETSSEDSALSSSSSSRHYAARGAGHHGMKALGRVSGGSGSSPLPSSSSSSSAPVKMAPGGGPSNEGADDYESDGEDDAAQANMHQPSSYTFRRRNAIVEGSEDAPKASEFSASGSGSE